MATDLSLAASGVVNVTTHISSESGLTSGTYAGITAALTYWRRRGCHPCHLGQRHLRRSLCGCGNVDLEW
jgi:hypothetical protein